jgi:hypothetical protein
MARFEMTLNGGEKILVDHAVPAMQELLQDVAANDFMLFSEIRGVSSAPDREIIVATRQITLIRPLDQQSRQGTAFRPKR